MYFIAQDVLVSNRAPATSGVSRGAFRPVFSAAVLFGEYAYIYIACCEGDERTAMTSKITAKQTSKHIIFVPVPHFASGVTTYSKVYDVYET